jgi:ectoine hydroxylase-related dioxygenase (phytanoyl-CoA dioxygenase family)
MAQGTAHDAAQGYRMSDEDRARFRADGVIKVSGAVPPETAARMLAAVDRVLISPGAAGGTGMDRHLHPHDEEFRAFLYETELASLAAQAMGSEAVRIYFDQIFVKEPETARVFHWHQDHPYWPIRGTQVASTWVALTAATVEASALEFVRGSHLWGRTYRPSPEGPGGTIDVEAMNRIWDNFGDLAATYVDEIEAFEDHPDRYDIVGFDVAPGDALLFDYRIVHRSRGNATPNRRVAVSWRWLGDDAIWAPAPGADPVIGPEHTWLQPGQRITDDAVFPLVHPARA